MKKIIGRELLRTFKYMKDTESVAMDSLCLRSKCGALIVKNINGRDKTLGVGFSSPPGGKKLERCLKDDLPKNFKSDATCCIHAEQNGIKHAINNYGEEMVKCSTLYFMRLDLNDEMIYAGKPYCTICSKEALGAGIKKWVLWHKQGIYSYDAEEYNEISFGRRDWELGGLNLP